MLTVKAPGKLFIAGEYAVVDGMPSILAGINRYITVRIKPSTHYGKILSRQYQTSIIYWRRESNHIIFDNRDNPFRYIMAAVRVTEAYARDLNHDLGFYDLKIDSQLDSPNGEKYGLGSSAAVTVATIHAICKYYHLPLTKAKLFKLAAIAHFSVQGNGSLGDIATSVYGGWIAFRTFDHQWLQIMRRSVNIKDLVNQKWPRLRIEPLTLPAGLKLLIGWTGSPASTSQLVDKVSLGKANHPEDFQNFLSASKRSVETMIKGFHTQSIPLIQKAIAQDRQQLAKLGAFTHVQIETPTLKQLCHIAIQNGGAAKSSGAGGGDCGIALVHDSDKIHDILQKWSAHHIQPLEFQVCNSLTDPKTEDDSNA